VLLSIRTRVQGMNTYRPRDLVTAAWWKRYDRRRTIPFVLHQRHWP